MQEQIKNQLQVCFKQCSDAFSTASTYKADEVFDKIKQSLQDLIDNSPNNNSIKNQLLNKSCYEYKVGEVQSTHGLSFTCARTPHLMVGTLDIDLGEYSNQKWFKEEISNKISQDTTTIKLSQGTHDKILEIVKKQLNPNREQQYNNPSTSALDIILDKQPNDYGVQQRNALEELIRDSLIQKDNRNFGRKFFDYVLECFDQAPSYKQALETYKVELIDEVKTWAEKVGKAGGQSQSVAQQHDR